MSRRNPFEEIERMFERMNRQFNELSELPATQGTQTVSVDVAEQDDEYVVTADLPGFEKDDIDLSINDRTLRLGVEHEERSEEREEGTYLRRERSRQSMSRTITLPEEVSEEDASASYNNGVLTVTLPKRDRDGDSRTIDIS